MVYDRRSKAIYKSKYSKSKRSRKVYRKKKMSYGRRKVYRKKVTKKRRRCRCR